LRLSRPKSILDPAMGSRFAVESVFWRRLIDSAARHIPAIFHRPLIWIAAFLFLFIARPARKALLRNLRLIRPRSSWPLNYPRVVRIFANFGWSLSDSATYRLLKPRFRYELEGARFLEQLAGGKGGIVLTAHMGNYDLGAALFTERFHRRMKMVRAPEADALSAQHVAVALRQASAGAVQVGYSSDGTSLAFDLLNDLRNGEIICIQGDRIIGDVARVQVKFFGQKISLPNGPFVLGFTAETPIYPLFIVRTGYRKYKIIGREPIVCLRGDVSRNEAVSIGMLKWAETLEEIVREYWPQWFAFTPLR
jgi:phosphatidylinositol dimannoside acyltransferase